MARTAITLFAITAALVACGRAAPEDNHGYGWHYDAAGVTGLRVRYHDEGSPRIETLEQVYREVAACMGVTDIPPGPLVIFTTGISGAEGEWKPSKGWLDTGTILLDATLDYNLPLVGFWNFRHELVHFLLHSQGFPIVDNQQHLSPFFNSCTVS